MADVFIVETLDSHDRLTYVATVQPGRYGFGTIGIANPAQAIADAKVLVASSPMAEAVDLATARFDQDGPTSWVLFDLKAGVDGSQFIDESEC